MEQGINGHIDTETGLRISVFLTYMMMQRETRFLEILQRHF